MNQSVVLVHRCMFSVSLSFSLSAAPNRDGSWVAFFLCLRLFLKVQCSLILQFFSEYRLTLHLAPSHPRWYVPRGYWRILLFPWLYPLVPTPALAVVLSPQLLCGPQSDRRWFGQKNEWSSFFLMEIKKIYSTKFHWLGKFGTQLILVT